MAEALKICFIGGRQAGVAGLLTALAAGHRILCAVSYSQDLNRILDILDVPCYKSIKDKDFVKLLKESDLLLSVHGREVVKRALLDMPRLGAINLHPYLYKYKGSKPVERAFMNNDFNASVGAHIMEEEVDEGKVLLEEFIDVSGSKSIEDIYNKLYPVYSIVLLRALGMVKNEKIC